MTTINIQKLKQFLIQNAIPRQFQSHLQGVKVSESLKMYKMNLQKIDGVAHKINSIKGTSEVKIQEKISQINLHWKRWELGLFVWTVIYYGYICQKSIQQFNCLDFDFFQTIFTKKTSIFLRHQAICIFSQSSKGKLQWEEEEDEILKAIVNQQKRPSCQYQWKKISFQLYSKSKCRYFRTYAQCRQRWSNHFDPVIRKQSWSKEEDLFLFRKVEQIGKKWSIMVKMFKGRTEHMIKNRYNSLMKKQRRQGQPLHDTQIHRKFINYWQRKLLKKGKLHDTTVKKQEQQIQYPQYVKGELQICQDDENSHEDKPKESEIKEEVCQAEYQCKNSNICFHLPSPLPEVKQQIDDNSYKTFKQIGFCQDKRVNYKDENLREVVDDVVESLGCGHPELLDMYFQAQDDQVFYEQSMQ